MGFFSPRTPPTPPPPPPPPPLPPPPTTYEIVEAGSFVGLQIGSCIGVALSPVVWLAQRSFCMPPLKFYLDILPRSGACGLASGFVAGAAAAYNVTSVYSESELQLWAHEEGTEHTWLRRTSENMRSTQWAILGLGTGAVFATPGPGSVLFTEAPWYWRLGGGCAVGVVALTLGFVASCHPACRDLVPYLPVGMQPDWAKPDGPATDATAWYARKA